VVDVTGRRVCAWSGVADGGRDGRITWNGVDDGGRPLPAGVYFARLTTPADRQTTRVVLRR
jgi:hypothetical protein